MKKSSFKKPKNFDLIVEKKIDIACNAHFVRHHHHADTSAEGEVAISASASG